IIALRILWQFRRDRRSLALIFVVPVVIMGLMTALIRSGSESLTMAVTGPGVPPGVTPALPEGGVALKDIGAKSPGQAIRAGGVRERSQGTLERLRASPVTTTETVLGYLGGFLVFGIVQSVIVLGFLVGVLRIHHSGNLGLVLLIQVLLVVIGVALGLVFSTV